MPYRKQQFANNEIYHIVLRGIDDNLIFKDIDDYYRGIFSIYEFNTTELITIQRRREARIQLKKEGRDPISIDARDKLIEILVFCFMPNHIHLLLRQIKDGGITKFMQKVGVGYAGYFNRKYGRKGYVFQNRFKDVYIKDDEQLKTIFVYIHTNPISLIEPNWKEEGIGNANRAIDFLENYKWSSYQDYLGRTNFPSVTNRELFLDIMGGSNGCKEFVDGWVKYKKEIKNFPKLELN